ncbi:MAG: phage antirepressor KilAC domain-containing protein [Ectothiorhodospiraceae bacterium]|nr:phage antirepressor KilAC domain-containing protein [Ectothiorhodospiraceae bacterium]
MSEQTHSLSAAAALLNIGRNTLARRLREEGVLGPDNLPVGRHRGDGRFVVRTRQYNHPITGWTAYGRTELTRKGLAYVARLLDQPAPQQEEEPMKKTIHTSDFAVLTPDNGNRVMPEGLLHDAGEFTVVSADGGRVHHRSAMVLVFDSPTDLQRAINAHRCAYRVRRDIPEEQLHPEAAARHG